MPFLRIEGALSTCRSHLNSLGTADPIRVEVEAYIVAAMVVLIVSEYEELVERLFVDRAAMCGDTHVASYVRTAIARKFRSPDLGKITEVLGYFGNDYKQTFSSKILNTEYHAAWDNIMRARHAVVHKTGPASLTFDELDRSYIKTKTVLSELKNTLGVP